MKKHEAERLIETIKGFIEHDKGDAVPPVPVRPSQTPPKAAPPSTGGNGSASTPHFAAGERFDKEALYQEFRARFIEDAKMDPVLLNLLLVQPEIIVEYERRVETIDGSSLRGRVARLVAQGFFGEPRTNSAVDKELGRTGTRPNSGNLSTTLAGLVVAGFLVRSDEGVVAAPGVKVTEKQLEV